MKPKKFKILSAEKNTRKGVDYEVKAIIFSFSKLKSSYVYIDLFDDVTAFKTEEDYYFIQSKNVEKFPISAVKDSLSTLYYNYIKLDGKKHILFVKNFSSKKDVHIDKENELISLEKLSNGSKDKINNHLGVDTYDFIDNTEIFICKRENFEYISDMFNANFCNEYYASIFDEVVKYVHCVKLEEVEEEYLTFQEYLTKYSNKKFDHLTLKNLVNKRTLGMDLIEELDGNIINPKYAKNIELDLEDWDEAIEETRCELITLCKRYNHVILEIIKKLLILCEEDIIFEFWEICKLIKSELQLYNIEISHNATVALASNIMQKEKEWKENLC